MTFCLTKNKKYSGIHATRGPRVGLPRRKASAPGFVHPVAYLQAVVGEEGRSTSLTAQMRVGHRKRRQNCSPVRHLCGNSIEALVREAQLSRCYSARIECRNCGHWLCV